MCGFEEGECRLCWAGAFPSFLFSLFMTPTATWKVVDAKAGVVKSGTYTAAMVENPEYTKPSGMRGVERGARARAGGGWGAACTSWCLHL